MSSQASAGLRPLACRGPLRDPCHRERPYRPRRRGRLAPAVARARPAPRTAAPDGSQPRSWSGGGERERSDLERRPGALRCTRPARPSRRRQASGRRHLRRPAPGTSGGETGAAVTGAPASRTRTGLRRPVGLSCHPVARTHGHLLSLSAAPFGEASSLPGDGASALSGPDKTTGSPTAGDDTPQRPPGRPYAMPPAPRTRSAGVTRARTSPTATTDAPWTRSMAVRAASRRAG